MYRLLFASRIHATGIAFRNSKAEGFPRPFGPAFHGLPRVDCVHSGYQFGGATSGMQRMHHVNCRPGTSGRPPAPAKAPSRWCGLR